MSKTLRISAKCSDMITVQLLNHDEFSADQQIEGEVPGFLGGGDYIRLEIDVATGQILDWSAGAVEAEFEREF